MSINVKDKIRATLIHMSITGGVFILTGFLVMQVWYPSLHFWINGGINGLQLMFFIDLVLGPCLTFIIYNRQKSRRTKLFDFSIIGLVQFSALIYGFHSVYISKPALLLFQPNGQIVTINQKEYSSSFSDIPLNKVGTFTQIPAIAQHSYVYTEQYKPFSQSAEVIRQASEYLQTQLPSEDKSKWKQQEKAKNDYLFSMIGAYYKVKVITDSEISYLRFYDKVPLAKIKPEQINK